MQFPSVNAHDLYGRSYDLPGDLPGAASLLCLGFHRWQRAVTAEWIRGVTTLEAGPSGLMIWEVAVISRTYAAARSFLDEAM
ncbi:MAG TPA: hypothetical protein VF902_05205, partial [Coriobacteriia bacterium]